jgi:histidinol-phosphate aminotransferase
MKSCPIRAVIRTLAPYAPGEQPRIMGLTKLNTNENPYPPSPRVIQALRRELDARLRLYPDPDCKKLCRRAAAVYGFNLDQVMAGNGSDEILALCLRAFVEERRVVQFPRPSYSLYPVLTQIQNGHVRQVPFSRDFELDLESFDPRAALTFVANPNAPSGTPIPVPFLRKLGRRLRGVLVIDEAYGDFARQNALELARRASNVLVTRSFSKSFSLAGMRVGLVFGSARLIGALYKVRDSYNVDRLAQTAAEAALRDIAYHRRCVKKVQRTREWFRAELVRRGWQVLPSEANFVFTRPPTATARDWLAFLRSRKILVRWFGGPQTAHYLRITIGTDAQMKRLLRVIDTR